MNKLRNGLFYIIVWGAIALLGGILLFSTFKFSSSTLKLPGISGLAFILAAAVIIFLLYKVNFISKIGTKLFLVILVIIALLPRLAWIYFIQTQPYSDFLHLHNYGVNASNGDFTGFVDFYRVFPFKMSFGLVLAGIYSIFGTSLMAVKIFNVIMSVALVLIIYSGGKLLFGDKAGRISGLLAALWPADIMFTSVVASEHLFLVLFTGASVLLLRFIKNYTYKNYEFTNGNLLLLALGLLTALAQLIRPMAILLLPVAAVFILIYQRYRSDLAASFGLKLKSIVLLCASYLVIINLINLPVQKITGIDVTRSDSGFNLMIGTNFSARGMFNTEDFSLIERNGYDIDKVHAEAQKIAFDRIKDNPTKLPRLFINKVNILWGNENYGYYWSTSPVKDTSAGNVVKSHPKVFYSLSQAFYVLIIMMSICACLYSLREKRYDSLIILMIFGGIFFSYLLLEVQSRYHLPVMPLLIMFGGSFLKAHSSQ